LIATAERQLEDYADARKQALTASIVTVLKEEGSYPYDRISGPIQAAERDMFDIVVVTARSVLGANAPQRAMSAKLLHLALQERPEALDEILRHTLRLSSEQMEDLAEMLRYSSLGFIVGAASEVRRRLELLIAIRHLLYDPEESAKLREVDQLHPLVKDNVWLFGEEWRLTRSEAGITTILRQILRDEDIAVEADLIREGSALVLPPGLRGRVDLLLQRTLEETDQRHRLVVELKRPSTAVGIKELAQVKRYAKALASHPGGGMSRWSFWLVGAMTHADIEDELNPADRDWGHVMKASNYDVWVTTWGRLANDAERKLQFFQDQLQYEIGQDDAVQHVRERHAAILEPEGEARAHDR
jgi:hypothetical protein